MTENEPEAGCCDGSSSRGDESGDSESDDVVAESPDVRLGPVGDSNATVGGGGGLLGGDTDDALASGDDEGGKRGGEGERGEEEREEEVDDGEEETVGEMERELTAPPASRRSLRSRSILAEVQEQVAEEEGPPVWPAVGAAADPPTEAGASGLIRWTTVSMGAGEDEEEDEYEDEAGVGLPPRRRRAWLSVGVCPLVDMFRFSLLCWFFVC